eukprot:754416-Prymnesium_polylepis.1
MGGAAGATSLPRSACVTHELVNTRWRGLGLAPCIERVQREEGLTNGVTNGKQRGRVRCVYL